MHLRALAAARNARIQAETLNSLLVIQVTLAICSAVLRLSSIALG